MVSLAAKYDDGLFPLGYTPVFFRVHHLKMNSLLMFRIFAVFRYTLSAFVKARVSSGARAM